MPEIETQTKYCSATYIYQKKYQQSYIKRNMDKVKTYQKAYYLKKTELKRADKELLKTISCIKYLLK